MAEEALILPKMGESIEEATIIRWLKNEGDIVEMDEPVVEIATDKVDSEVPSTAAGIMGKVLYGEGDTVKVGEIITHILSKGSSLSATPEVQTEAAKPPVEQVEARVNKAVEIVEQVKPAGNRFYSPLVMTIARTEGVSMTDLENIQGSGKDGRVTKKDILGFVKNGSQIVTKTSPVSEKPVQVATPKEGSKPTQAPAPKEDSKPTQVSAPKEESKPTISVSGGDEIIQMDRMRKLIANHMVNSVRTSPHVTSFVEADVTNLVKWRNKHKNAFLAREGEKLTFTPLFIEAIVKSIRDFPMINVRVDGDNIIKKKDINIGMAAALPSGNLIVPVIKQAQTKNLIGLAKSVNDLANRARNNKLKPDEISGGTYTFTNVGGFGNLMGTPIINQPQVAILAAGAIVKKPAVIETPDGDMIGIRHFMFLSHSYDHRVVDGALGGMFVRRVADYLEQWDSEREI